MLGELIFWFEDNFFEELVSINILRDNKYLIEENRIYKREELIRFIGEYNFSFDGGSENEFYISTYNFRTGEKEKEYTIQVSNFEIDNSLEL